MADTKTLAYLIKFKVDPSDIPKVERIMENLKRKHKDLGVATKRTDEATKKLAGSFAGLALRAVVVIPIWLALRNVFLSFVNTLREGIQHIKEFDKIMARAAAVTHDVTNKIEALAQLRNEIRLLSVMTGESVDKVGEAYYRFGTAGHEFEISVIGMNLAVKTGIAIMGDSTQTAQVMADMYNVLKNNITGVTTKQEKLQKMASSIAVLWAHNSFQLNEFNIALSKFAAVGKTYNLTMDQMLSLTAVSHTLMQKGGTAGTQLARSFMMLTRNTERAERYLGRLIDLDLENMFDVYLEILKKVNSESDSAAKRAQVLTDIFGMKGIKVTASFAANLEKVVEELERLDKLPLEERMKKFDELMKIQMHTVDRQLKRFRELKQVSFEMFAIGVTGANDYVTALENLNAFMENTVIPTSMFWGIVIRRLWRDVGNLYSDIKSMDMSKVDWGLTYEENLMQNRFKEIYKPPAQITPTSRGRSEDPSDIFKRTILAAYKVADAEGRVIEQVRILTEELKFTEEQAKSILDPIDELDYMLMLSKQGVSTINELIEKQNKGTKVTIDLEEKKAAFGMAFNASREKQIKQTESLQNLGFTSVEIEQQKLDLMIQTGVEQEKLYKQALKLMDAQQKQMAEFTNKFRSAFEDAFTGLLKGENTFEEFLDKFLTGTTNTLAEGLSSALTDVFASTGIFEAGGGFLSGLKGMFGGLKGQISGAMITGGMTAGQQIYAMMVSAGAIVAGQIQAGMMQGGIGMPGGGKPPAGAVGGLPLMGMATGGFMGGMLGYQSGGVAGGILGGLGGAMMMSGNPYVMAVGGAMLLGSMLMGAFKKDRKTTVETREQTVQVTSRIDVTNKQLELVNRNLMAMRQDLTYIMPRSSYFSEQNNIEDQFSIDARRGT